MSVQFLGIFHILFSHLFCCAKGNEFQKGIVFKGILGFLAAFLPFSPANFHRGAE